MEFILEHLTNKLTEEAPNPLAAAFQMQRSEKDKYISLKKKKGRCGQLLTNKPKSDNSKNHRQSY